MFLLLTVGEEVGGKIIIHSVSHIYIFTGEYEVFKDSRSHPFVGNPRIHKLLVVCTVRARSCLISTSGSKSSIVSKSWFCESLNTYPVLAKCEAAE